MCQQGPGLECRGSIPVLMVLQSWKDRAPPAWTFGEPAPGEDAGKILFPVCEPEAQTNSDLVALSEGSPGLERREPPNTLQLALPKTLSPAGSSSWFPTPWLHHQGCGEPQHQAGGVGGRRRRGGKKSAFPKSFLPWPVDFPRSRHIWGEILGAAHTGKDNHALSQVQGLRARGEAGLELQGPE